MKEWKKDNEENEWNNNKKKEYPVYPLPNPNKYSFLSKKQKNTCLR